MKSHKNEESRHPHGWQTGNEKSPDQLRSEALVRNSNRAVRIQDELEDMLKLCRFQREALQNECMDAFGYKQMAADAKTVQKTEKLALAYTRLTDAQIKLNKHMKEIAEVMTPEEEKDAVRKYINAMSQFDRGAFLHALIAYHNSQAEHGKMNPDRIKGSDAV